MLSHNPSPNFKCKFNILLFLTLPHRVDCLICAKDIMNIVLLIMIIVKLWLDWKRGIGWFMLQLGTRDKGWVSYLFWVSYYTDTFCSDFVMLFNVLSWLVHEGYCICFFVSFLIFDGLTSTEKEAFRRFNSERK